MADLITRVGVIEDWRKEYVDPHCRKIDELEVSHEGIATKINTLTTIGLATLTLIVGLIIALFTWGINQVHLKVEAGPINSPSDAKIPTLTR